MNAPNQKKFFKIILSGVCSLALQACISYDIGDLEEQVSEVLQRPGGRIEPLPEIKPYESYAYESGQENAKDPFLSLFAKPQDEAAVGSGLTAEMEREIKDRNREELEQFELDSLKMVGTLEDSEDYWGIILDPDKVIHRIKVGNYIGLNVGKVTNIFENRIELREIVQNSQGRWEEREAALALDEL